MTMDRANASRLGYTQSNIPGSLAILMLVLFTGMVFLSGAMDKKSSRKTTAELDAASFGSPVAQPAERAPVQSVNPNAFIGGGAPEPAVEAASASAPILPNTGAAAAPQLYTVQRGDTMGQIARAYNVSLQALQAANPQISNPNLIYPGQELVIPAP